MQDLRDDGSVMAPGHGWWRWTEASTGDEQPNDLGEVEPMFNEDQENDALEPIVQSEREIGVGNECVYLYFNPNDRRLAELEGRAVWECKIGRTSSSDAISRIMTQGIKTSLSHFPIVGLVIRSNDAAALERALHSSLRLIEAEVADSPGIEWFITSPSRVEAWYERFLGALASLEHTETK